MLLGNLSLPTLSLVLLRIMMEGMESSAALQDNTNIPAEATALPLMQLML
jgi:hypothetical protein